VFSNDEATAFRGALRDYCTRSAEFSSTLTSEMSAALTSAAKAARARGLTAERFVIWIKQAWDELADDRVMQHRTDPARDRDTVVSAAIKAYYMQ